MTVPAPAPPLAGSQSNGDLVVVDQLVKRYPKLPFNGVRVRQGPHRSRFRARWLRRAAAGDHRADRRVALEKILFGTLRALIAGAIMFPIGRLVLGTLPFQASRTWLLIAFLLLGAVMGSGLGMTLGTLVQPSQISIVFALVLTPLLFTGCTQYPWPSLSSLRWFQVLTLVNPLTYVSEGVRASMVPQVPHMHAWIAVIVLIFATVGLVVAGVMGFMRRAID